MNFDPVKLAFWAKHLQDWSVSGLSLIDYCRRQAIGYSTFYTWRKRLDSVTVELAASKTLATTSNHPVVAEEMKPVSTSAMRHVPAKKAINPLQLVPVSIGIAAKAPEIMLRSPAGWQVTIFGHVHLPELAQLLRQMP